MLEETKKILSFYKTPDAKYLLPIIIGNVQEDSIQAKKLISQWIKTTNKYLKRIGTEIGLESPLTTYVARHTWATTAKRLGYSNELMSSYALTEAQTLRPERDSVFGYFKNILLYNNVTTAKVDIMNPLKDLIVQQPNTPNG